MIAISMDGAVDGGWGIHHELQNTDCGANQGIHQAGSQLSSTWRVITGPYSKQANEYAGSVWIVGDDEEKGQQCREGAGEWHLYERYTRISRTLFAYQWMVARGLTGGCCNVDDPLVLATIVV